MRAIVVSATSTDSSSGSSWIPLGNRRFSITTVSSRVSRSNSSTLRTQHTDRSPGHRWCSQGILLWNSCRKSQASLTGTWWLRWIFKVNVGIYSEILFYFERSEVEVVPSVRRGLHDQVHVVSALPPAAGVGEVHLLPVLRHRHIVDERQLPAGDHLPPRHQPGWLACSEPSRSFRCDWLLSSANHNRPLTHLWWGSPQTNPGRRRPQTKSHWVPLWCPEVAHRWTPPP